MSEKSHFEALAGIDVSKQCEKKNGFTYLSWAWAVDTLLRADPTATWEYGEPMRFNDSVMVFCTVTAFAKPMTMQLPVIDFRNKPISNPSAMDVNTAMMRCLVKAIALHGSGLYIYAGEDIPQEAVKEEKKESKTRLPTLVFAEAEMQYNAWIDEKLQFVGIDGVENEVAITNAWGNKASNIRTAIKKYGANEYEEQKSEVHPDAQQHLNSITKEEK